jgi:hypothetical protein
MQVAKLERTALRREEKERERAIARQRRMIEKAQREERRHARRQRGDLFSSLTDSQDAGAAEDERSRRAESFFGGGKTGVEKPEKPQLTFWQRLKQALFGS